MNIGAVKKKYGDRLCLIGNLSVTTTLPHGTPDDVACETLECLREAAPGGGYILAADHSFHGGVPPANVWRALETCRQFGQYPLDMAAIEAEWHRLKALEAAA
jgi:uroporphyrinogen decarboxylase